MSPAPTAAATEPAEATAPAGSPAAPTDGPGSSRPVLLGTVTALQLIRRAA